MVQDMIHPRYFLLLVAAKTVHCKRLSC